MKSISQRIDHDTFCQLIDEAESVVDLPDGGQIAFLEEGRMALFSVMSGEGCIIE